MSFPALGETEQLFEQQRQAQEDLQAELVESLERNKALEEMCTQLEDRLSRAFEEAELERLRALEELRQKYDDRKGANFAATAEAARELFTRLSASASTPRGKGDLDAANGTAETAVTRSGQVEPPRTTEVSSGSTAGKVKESGTEPVAQSTTTALTEQKGKQPPVISPGGIPSDLSAALLAQQLPPLPKFSGSEASSDEDESFQGQFELVAEVCK